MDAAERLRHVTARLEETDAGTVVQLVLLEGDPVSGALVKHDESTVTLSGIDEEITVDLANISAVGTATPSTGPY